MRCTIQIKRTPRVMQVEGIFDLPPAEISETFREDNFLLPETPWSVGAIMGPSGAGKSMLLAEHFGRPSVLEWDPELSVIDGFPEEMQASEITGLLSSVGFSSPPSWLRPFHALSNGEQFRVNLARLTAEAPLVVVDEFTSVVDRDVAQIASSAVAKTIRRMGKQLVVASCHYDVLDWLEPDWVYQPHLGKMYTGRSLHRRPQIELEIHRVSREAWAMFAPHHYLSAELSPAAKCWVAFWKERPVAFTSMVAFPHPKLTGVWREHRTVCLPDFQGVGIGMALSDAMGAMVKALGLRYWSHTTHPAFTQARVRSKHWSLQRMPKIQITKRKHTRFTGAKTFAWRAEGKTDRPVSRFEYVGPAMEKEEAEKLWTPIPK